MTVPTHLRAVFTALGAYIAFSAADVCCKFLSADFSALQIVACKDILVLPLLFLFVTRGRDFHVLKTRRLHWHAGRAILFFAQTVGAYYGFVHLPLADTYTYIFVIPIFTVIFAVLLLKERLTLQQTALIALAFAGVLVAFHPDPSHLDFAVLVVLASSVCGGLSQVILRYLSTRETFAANLVWTSLFSVIYAIIFSYAEFVMPTVHQWALFALAACCTATALILVTKAFCLMPASEAASYNYSQMIWAPVLGYVFFGDQPNLWVLAGAVIIIAAGLGLARLQMKPLVNAADLSLH